MPCKRSRKGIKLESLCRKIKQMWNKKCMNIPVIIETIGIVINCLKKNLEAMPVTPSIS
jgi:hypothetical protein